MGAVLALIAGATPACNCSKNTGRNGDGGAGGGSADMGVPAIGSISITPADVTLDITNGGPPAMQAFTVTIHDPSMDRDVTAGSTFVLSDPTIGVMNANTFSTGTSHGGDTALTASYTPPNGTQQQAMAIIHIRVKGTFNGPDCGNMGQPACPTFPGDTAPACPAGIAAPNIVYPPDGVLLPPNMSVISVMWTPFPAAATVQSFEVAFKNANTDVRVVTTCATQTMDTDTPPAPSNGCELQLTQQMWDFIAGSNRGGDALTVSVRASADGTCATPSTTNVNISFASQDLNGGLFYWKSSITAGGVGGNIFAKNFGDPATPETQITGVAGTNLANATCFGCHALSRDGSRMTVNFDDADSDDEYSDVVHTLMDVASKSSIDGQTTYGQFEPGFQAIAPDNKLYVATNGMPAGATNSLFLFDATSGAALNPATITFGAANTRPTMPDWSPDGKTLMFVVPAQVGSWDKNQRNDDDHVFGGSIYTASYDATTTTFGTPTALITSKGENNYYPGYSPDGAFIVYNRVEMQPNGPACTNPGSFGSCPNDSFSNPKARVWILSTTPNSVPFDAEKANGSPANAAVDVSNSWPRWSPFVQMYKGSPLLWVTFSSTRDYGLRVRNHKTGFAQCIPADSLQDPGGKHSQPFPAGCQQPQIWMAAVNLATAELMGANDPSFPAFWLPYQDITKHNHTAQWTQTVAGTPMNDMGVCIANGADCTSNPNACCSQTCLGTGVCGTPIP